MNVVVTSRFASQLVAKRAVLDASCVATMKHERPSYSLHRSQQSFLINFAAHAPLRTVCMMSFALAACLVFDALPHMVHCVFSRPAFSSRIETSAPGL